MPKKDDEQNRVSHPEMITALARHEVAKHLRESDTVTKAELRAHVRQALETFAEMLGEEIGMVEKRLNEEHAAELAKLRAEMKAMPEPIDLPPLKLIGGRS